MTLGSMSMDYLEPLMGFQGEFSGGWQLPTPKALLLSYFPVQADAKHPAPVVDATAFEYLEVCDQLLVWLQLRHSYPSQRVGYTHLCASK